MAQRGKCGSTRKSPDWGLNPGPPGYILGALTTELYGPEYRVLVSDSYQLCDRLLIQQPQHHPTTTPHKSPAMVPTCHHCSLPIVVLASYMYLFICNYILLCINVANGVTVI